MKKKMTPKGFRIERDSMGEMYIPSKMLYGASTQRAVINFPISGRRFPRGFIRALAQIKLSAAKANRELGLLNVRQSAAIARAAEQVVGGAFDEHFVVDVFQTGSGTSSNMNANEVIATLANRVPVGLKSEKIHPNDHVNMGQSSNDVIPTAIHISTWMDIRDILIPEMSKLEKSLRRKASEFRTIFKVGRTHLQDATPVTLGQEFGGYAEQAKKAVVRLRKAMDALRELPLGGTAVGTGINTHPKFASLTIRDINRVFNANFYEAKNHFEAQSAKDACVETSGVLKTISVSLIKMANDIRWLGCGPRAGFFEMQLPSVQPGSSIMPGKTNPVIAEALIQVACEVIGNDTTITHAGHYSNFELNVMMPLIAYKLLESIRLLTNGVSVFRTRCIDGISANRDVCGAQIEKSLMLSTPLVPVIGYDKAADVAKTAFKEGKTIREVVLEKKLISAGELKKLLDVKRIT